MLVSRSLYLRSISTKFARIVQYSRWNISPRSPPKQSAANPSKSTDQEKKETTLCEPWIDLLNLTETGENPRGNRGETEEKPRRSLEDVVNGTENSASWAKNLERNGRMIENRQRVDGDMCSISNPSLIQWSEIIDFSSMNNPWDRGVRDALQDSLRIPFIGSHIASNAILFHFPASVARFSAVFHCPTHFHRIFGRFFDDVSAIFWPILGRILGQILGGFLDGFLGGFVR